MFKALYTYSQTLNLETIYFIDWLTFSLINNNIAEKNDPFANYQLWSLVLTFASFASLLTQRFELKWISSLYISLCFCFSLMLIAGGLTPFIVFAPLVMVFLSNQLICNPHSSQAVKMLALMFELYAFLMANVLAFTYFLLSRLVYPQRILGGLQGLRTFLFFVLTFMIFYFTSENSIFFDYPVQARLFDISSFQRMGEVVFGQERLPFSVIPAVFLAERRKVVALGALLLFPFMVYFGKRLFRSEIQRNVANKGLVMAMLVMCLSWFSSSLFSEGQFFNSPEGVAFSVVPGIIWHFSPWFSFGIILLVTYLLFLKFKEFRRLFYKTSIPVLLLAYLFSNIVLDLKSGVVHIKENFAVSENLYYTPSSYLLNYYNLSPESLNNLKGTFSAVSLEQNQCSISSSRSTGLEDNILDKNFNSKWATQGFQKPGDWLQITCEKPVRFNRLALNVGGNTSDFPRGFKIEAGTLETDLVTINTFPLWLGQVELSPSGLPYFSGQDRVVVDFSEERSANILKFTLLEGHPVFDWSIVELEFFRSA